MSNYTNIYNLYKKHKQAETTAVIPVEYTKPVLVPSNPFDELHRNMTRLQELHSTLRQMLSDLEEIVSKK